MRAIRAFALVAACAPVTPPPVPLAHAVLPDVPFDQLDLDQRADYMKVRVVPTMAPLFADHVSDFGCKTCHGEPKRDGRYTMPNPSLPRLGPEMETGAFEPADVEWMTTKIKPTMAGLLARTEWTAANPMGFGCIVCHTLDE